MSATVQAIMDRLVAAGGRRTATRQAIIETIAASGTHVTAETIAAAVQERFPSINISTVYRTLDALTEFGVIEHIHFGHGPATYHLTDDAHQHLFCESCGAVEEVPTAKLGPFVRMLHRDYGFTLDQRHFAILGHCRACG